MGGLCAPTVKTLLGPNAREAGTKTSRVRDRARSAQQQGDGALGRSAVQPDRVLPLPLSPCPPLSKFSREKSEDLSLFQGGFSAGSRWLGPRPPGWPACAGGPWRGGQEPGVPTLASSPRAGDTPARPLIAPPPATTGHASVPTNPFPSAPENTGKPCFWVAEPPPAPAAPRSPCPSRA